MYLQGMPTSDLFEVRDTMIESTDLADGGVLLDILVMSVDPYLRGLIRTPTAGEVPTGGKLMEGFVAGRVRESRTSTWRKGDFFGASLSFSTAVLLTKEQLANTLMWNLTGHVDESTIQRGIGVLGMPGCTAYAGVLDVLQPKKGETIFVSAASGAVGSLVSQVAKLKGAKVAVGSCGGAKKSDAIKGKFSYDHAIDYKSVKNKDELIAKLKEAAPDGIDMYFENVGGMHFEAAFASLKPRGRIAVCGTISGYNENKPQMVQLPLSAMFYPSLRIEGFIVFDWLTGEKESGKNFVPDMSRWLAEGKIYSEETVVTGVEKWGEAFCSLFSGSKHLGKLAVKM